MLTVESGRAVLAALERARLARTPFDLLLLDLNMPDMDGLAVADRVMQNPQLSLPIILLSSAGQRGDAARCREIGVAGYLTKPMMSGELIDAIQAVLAGSDAGRPSSLVTRHSLQEARRRLRLLVAEDNPVNRTMVARMLEKRGHYVHVAENGHEALAALAADAFDLVLMDVQMPGLDGFATTAAIREKERGTDRHLPIVALTAHAMKGDRERCLAAGMDGYATKPIEWRDLFATIDELARGEEPVAARLAPEPEPDVRVFDLSAAMRNTAEDRGMLAEIARLCLEDCSQQLPHLHAALERPDADGLKQIAHRIKGGLKTVAALAAAQAAERLELVASNGDLAACRLAVSALETELQRLTPVLQALLKAA